MNALDTLEAYADARGEHLTREELEADDPHLIALVHAALEEAGVEPDQLDELVYEACMERASVEANHVVEAAALGEVVSGEQAASIANNGGLHTQVAALVQAHGNHGMVQRLLDVVRPSGPRP